MKPSLRVTSAPLLVIPAQAGIHSMNRLGRMDPRLRGDDGNRIITAIRILCFLLALLSAPAFAGSLPQDRLENPALESRAEHLFSQLRCLVCQNQTIIDSDARIAHDLRLLVRTRLQQGDSDAAILDYIHSRYGDFVLMKPPFTPTTWALWLGPGFILLLGGGIVLVILRQQKRGEA